MQLIYDGKKVRVWEFAFQGVNIGKWSTGKHCDGIAVVKKRENRMFQKGGTLPLTHQATTYYGVVSAELLLFVIMLTCSNHVVDYLSS